MPIDRKKFLSGNLNQIALSLSGGGVRAIGFHLGTMSMLRRLGLIRNIEILSTVSGGSMPGIGYSLAQQVGRSFQDFFDDFYAFLPQLNILEQLLKGMTNRCPPAPSGRRDMITSMANIYEEFYFERYFGSYVKGGALTFDVLLNQPGRGHLKEMIFNATEFKTGTAFRFQVSQYRCLIGNGNISLCRKHAGQIRIADIMASSSCIPVGMEPLFFPDDFRWPDDGPWGERRKSRVRPTNEEIRAALERNTNTGKPTFALMDGGVYDNQGITSTLLALNRRQNKITEPDTHECGVSMSSLGRSEPPGPEEWANWMSGRQVHGSTYKFVGVKPEDLDLLIISDTPVRKASFFPRIPHSRHDESNLEETNLQKRGKIKAGLNRIKVWIQKRITVGFISFLTWVLFFALLLSAVIAAIEYLLIGQVKSELPPTVTLLLVTFHLLLPFLLIVLIVLGIFTYYRKKRKLIRKLKDLIPDWERKPKKYLNKLRLFDLIEMGVLRGGSTAALTSAIFMDRIRGLGYSAAFSREDLHSKILANEIFALQEERDPNDPFYAMLIQQGAWPPPPELRRIVEKAATMSTKLWIDQEEGDPLSDLDYLVVCGQATICYNILKYLWEELRDDDGSWLDPKMSGVFEQALSEWKKLMADPLSLLKDRKRKSRLDEMKAQALELEGMTQAAH